MKKNLLNFYIFTLCLFSSIAMFATDPSNTGEGGDSIEDPEAPINSRLIWLLVAGIAFAFYYYSNNRKKQVNQ